MKIRYDPIADGICIYFGGKRKASRTQEVPRQDSLCLVDYDKEGNPIGIEVLGTKTGIDVTGLPREEEVAELLRAHGFQALARSRKFYYKEM